MEPKKFNLSVPAAIIFAGIIIGGAILVTKYMPTSPSDSPDTATKKITMEPVTNADHILGNPNADLIIVEYSDTECPYCKEFHKTLHTIIDEYGKDGKVAWVYRHFPIAQLHAKAQKEAEATECATDIGGKAMFWTYTDRIYAITPSNDGLDPAKLYTIAEELGLNKDAFAKCLDSGKFTKKVEAQYQDALNAGANGTPYSIIVTKKGEKIPLEGAYPIEYVRTTIEGLLKGR